MEHDSLIRKLKPNEEIPYKLLLLADETIEAIDKYIHDSEIYVYEKEDKILAVYALMNLGNGIAEIKNIAVRLQFQGKEIGSIMLNHATTLAKEKGLTSLIVGTPNSAARQINFYEKKGFVKSGIKKDFYLLNYPAPIYENGQRLRDMVILKKKVSF